MIERFEAGDVVSHSCILTRIHKTACVFKIVSIKYDSNTLYVENLHKGCNCSSECPTIKLDRPYDTTSMLFRGKLHQEFRIEVR